MNTFVKAANEIINSILWKIETMSRVNPIGELIEMHKYCRPAGSETEKQFSRRFIKSLKGVRQDAKGNWIGQIGENPTVLWSSHTDTVHRKPGFQILAVGRVPNAPPEADQWLFLSQKETVANCLGADCTVGVWLMRRMYLAGIPGLYIWHADEESGGQGSRYIAAHTPEVVKGIKAAIAFDRKGTTNVITRQFGSRCASVVFAESLASMLPGKYTSDPTGTFTDTASYVDLIGECTNISVGYQGAHTDLEQTNLGHASRLLEAMLKFDETKLVFSRKPGEDEYPTYVIGGSRKERKRLARRGNQYGSYDPLSYGWTHVADDTGGYKSGYKYDHKAERWVPPTAADSENKAPPTDLIGYMQRDAEMLDLTEASALEARIRANPQRAAELIMELGFSYDDIIKWW